MKDLPRWCGDTIMGDAILGFVTQRPNGKWNVYSVSLSRQHGQFDTEQDARNMLWALTCERVDSDAGGAV